MITDLEGARCVGVTAPLWDNHVPGETPAQRHRRHHRAIARCRTCPVIDACLAAHAADPEPAGGVWGGEVFSEHRPGPPRTAVCRGCGKLFHPDGPAIRYCGATCRDAAHSRRYRNPRVQGDVHCRGCGEPISREHRQRRVWYCRDECRLAADRRRRRGRGRERMAGRLCKMCDVPLTGEQLTLGVKYHDDTCRKRWDRERHRAH